MPIIRKLIKSGRSYLVSLPKSWVTNAEQENGRSMNNVSLEVNGNITLKPVFEDKRN